MGLWLGLGVVQAIQVVVQYLVPFLRRRTQKSEAQKVTHNVPIKVSR